MNRKAFALAILAAGSCSAAWAGSIEGKVTVAKGLSVVYVEAIAGKTFPAPSQHPVVAQAHLMFQPHVIPVQQGTTVDFLNNDSVAHNVFWPSVGGNKKLGHNLGTWPKDQRRSFKFDAAGSVPLFCNVHPDMTAYIVVVPTPYFAMTNEAGEYRIEGVPDGSYNLTAWNEGSKSQSKHVDVAGGATADFTLSR